jgi:hypothetical protein
VFPSATRKRKFKLQKATILPFFVDVYGTLSLSLKYVRSYTEDVRGQEADKNIWTIEGEVKKGEENL